jgi:hypothetical protein
VHVQPFSAAFCSSCVQSETNAVSAWQEPSVSLPGQHFMRLRSMEKREYKGMRRRIARTHARKQVPELCRRASASWGVGSRGSGRRRPGSRAGSGGRTGVRGRAGGGGRRRHSRLG